MELCPGQVFFALLTPSTCQIHTKKRVYPHFGICPRSLGANPALQLVFHTIGSVFDLSVLKRQYNVQFVIFGILTTSGGKQKNMEICREQVFVGLLTTSTCQIHTKQRADVILGRCHFLQITKLANQIRNSGCKLGINCL